jgi:hypothetical protein
MKIATIVKLSRLMEILREAYEDRKYEDRYGYRRRGNA